MFRLRCIDMYLEETERLVALDDDDHNESMMIKIVRDKKYLEVDDTFKGKDIFRYGGFAWATADFAPYEDKILIGGELL